MRCKSFPLLKIYILFREFSLLLACTVILVGFSGQAPVLDLFEAFVAFPSSQEFGRMEDISCNVK